MQDCLQAPTSAVVSRTKGPVNALAHTNGQAAANGDVEEGGSEPGCWRWLLVIIAMPFLVVLSLVSALPPDVLFVLFTDNCLLRSICNAANLAGRVQSAHGWTRRVKFAKRITALSFCFGKYMPACACWCSSSRLGLLQVGAIVWIVLLPLKIVCCPIGCLIQIMYDVFEYFLKAPFRAVLWASGKPWKAHKPAKVADSHK